MASDGLSSHWAVLLISLWLATAGNVALWQHLLEQPGLANPDGLLFALSLGVAIAATICALLTLLAWRWTFKPAAVLLLMLAAVSAHVTAGHGVVMTPSTVTPLMLTPSGDASGLLSGRLLLTVALLGVLPSIGVWRCQIQFQSAGRQVLRNGLQLLVALAVATLVVGFQGMAGHAHSHHHWRGLVNPLHTLHALGVVASSAALDPSRPSQDARPGANHVGRQPASSSR